MSLDILDLGNSIKCMFKVSLTFMETTTQTTCMVSTA